MPDDYAKIIVAVNHGELTRVRNATAISGTINALKCHIEFRTKDWNVLNKTIVFARGKATASTPKEDIFPPQILDDSNECIVPPGVLNDKYFSIGLIGLDEDYRIVTNWLHYRVDDGCYAEGGATFDPPKTIYDEILEELKNHKHDERYYTKNQIDDKISAISIQAGQTYVHTQDQAASVWKISHNLSKYPSVSIVDSAGSVVVGEITYINKTELIVSFTGAFSGKAILN